MMRKLSFVVFLVAVVVDILAQNTHSSKRLEWSHFGISDGISHTQVNHSFQDSRGVLWLAAQDGLNVLDGHRVYGVASWPSLISHRVIQFRMEDHKGLIWLRYFDDRRLFFRVFDIRTRMEVEMVSRVDTIKTGMPVDIACDEEGFLLLINSRSEVWKEERDGTWILFADGLGPFRTFCSGRQFQKRIWLSTENPYLEPDDIRITTLDGNGNRGDEIRQDGVVYMSCLEPDRVWIQCLARIGFISHDGTEHWVPLLKDLGISTFSERLYTEYDYKRGTLWIWHRDQLIVVDCTNFDAGEKLTPLASVNLKVIPFSMVMGRNGHLFLSSDDGVYISRLVDTRFQKILWKDDAKLSRLQLREARGMLETSQGAVFLLVGNLLHQYNRKTGLAQQVHGKEVGISPLIEDPENGSLWFGVVNNFMPGTNSFLHYPFALAGDWGVTWSSAFIDKDQLFLGTSEGLVVYDTKRQVASEFSQYNGFEEFRRASVYFMKQEDPGEWWFLTDKGLFRYGIGKGIIEKQCASSTGNNWLPGDNFRHYHKDSTGNYWFATSQGLIKWNRKSGIAQKITREQGLPNDNLYAVYGDKNGYLWLSSDYGIVQYHPETGSIRIYLQEDGISNNEFNRISHLQLRDGTLLFGGINGVTLLNPDHFKFDVGERGGVGVVVMSIKSMSAKQSTDQELVDDFYQNNKITLQPGNNLLNIEFSLPNYFKEKAVSYSYKVEGLSSEWVFTKSPVVQLLGLAPGRYTLLIRGNSGSGEVSGDSCELIIEVLPYYYQESWFWFIILTIIGLLVWLLLRFRERVLVIYQKELEHKVAESTNRIREDKELIERQAQLLATQNEAQRRFFANITHEFRTPLSLVMGPVDVVRKQSNLSRRYKSLLDISHQNSKRLLDLVDGVLVMSSLDVQQWRRREEMVSIPILISSIAEEYSVLADQKQISFNIDCKMVEHPHILTDPRAVRIVLNNLLSNAIKFTPNDGKVEVIVSETNSELTISVKDSGRGIPLEDLSKIFDRYFQTSRTDVPLEGGTGIGLSVAKELIELMGGRIKVESSVGKGALFTAVFPVKLPKDTVSGGRASAVSKETKGKTFNSFKKSERVILLVEDNLDFQHYIDFLLNEYYTILVTSNGLEALNLLYEGHLPDLIISDWMMPEMDGFQLAEKIKLEPKFSSIPIVFLTARSMESDMEKAVRLGIDDYLVKPFEEEALFAIVNQLLKRTKSRADASLQQGLSDRIELNLTDEQAWLETLQKETLDRISNDLFSVDQLASVMLMGRTKFYKEVRRLTGLTPNEYILEARLVRARMLMDTHNDLTLKKVVQMVGLKDEGNFSRAFKKRFGNPPSWYL